MQPSNAKTSFVLAAIGALASCQTPARQVPMPPPRSPARAVTAPPASVRSLYVAPHGTPRGDGSISDPWDLQTALNQPAAVQPGDTIWLRGGTYVGHFVSNLDGTAANPIIVRQYPGERATIDGNYGGNSTTLTVNGSYTWYWGFEVMNSSGNRTSPDPGNTLPALLGSGMDVLGPGSKVINMVIHDAAEGLGLWMPATGGEAYGNLIYYNGWDNPDRGSGHGIYTQNDTPTKRLVDNIILDQFSYGIHAYTEGSTLNNLDFEGNTSFENGILSQVSGRTKNILLGASGSPATSCTSSPKVAQNPLLVSNFTYYPQGGGGQGGNVGYTKGSCTPTIQDNYLASGDAFDLSNPFGVITITGNTFYGSISGFTSSAFPDNTYYSSRPTGVKIFTRPNQYEAGRANITVYNWDLASTVSVDLSGVLSIGSVYEIRNAQDFYATPVLSGTYDGNPLSIPMTGLTVATPVGWTAPPPTGPEFNAFVVITPLAPFNFYDVLPSSPYYPFVYLIAKNGITAGCGVGYFCPDTAVTRAQMAVFLLKGEHGSGYTPPACSGIFTDVTCTPGVGFSDWIEQLSDEGITAGCGVGYFCPDNPVTRAQMAVFLLRAEHGSSYAPPACTGIFQDVACTPTPAFAVDWIEQLYAEGITGGCSSSPLLYCPDSPNTRGEMAVFLVKTFQLQ